MSDKFRFMVLSLLALLGATGCNAPQPSTGSEERAEAFRLDGLTDAERQAGVFTPEVMWKMGRVGGMALSPDGEQVLYSVSRYNVSQNRGATSIFLQPIPTGEAQEVVENGHSPQWFPTGAKFAFLRSVDGVNQLFVKSKGAAAKQISALKEGIESFWISPDGTKLLYSSFVQVGPTTTDRHEGMDKANVRIIDSLMYRHWNYWVDGRYSHLFLADLSEESLSAGTDLMPGAYWDCPMSPYFDAADVAWSTDSKSFFYVAKTSTGREYATTTNSNIFHYDIASGTAKNLTESNPGYDKQPVISPDGASLLWQRMLTPGYESDRARLVRMDLATGQVEELMAAYDQNADAFGWMPDGQSVYIISALKGTVQLFSLDVATKALTQLTDGQWDVNWARPLAEGGWLVQRTQLNKGAELYLYQNGEFTPFTHINDDIYAAVKMSEVKERWIRTTDGGQMLTWVVLPPDFDSTKRYPALLYCQGGPQNTVSQFWSYRWNLQLMASAGYVVVAPNRHGVPSFGQAWNAQISGDYSGQNIRDYFSAIDEVAKEPWVDEERLGAVGASYGGYSVFYLAGVHQGRFKAFIAHNGMFNLESFYAGTEETFFPNHDFGGPYWDKGNAVAQRTYANSPHLNVGKWDTPILIYVGCNDFRIPYTEGLQAFNAAQLRGIPAKLLVFPEETHFVTAPQNAIIWQREFFSWLDRWLKG